MQVNFLWIGDSLTKMGQLTLQSFIDNGHEPVLWLYNTECKSVPHGVTIHDANQIVPSSRIFTYKGIGDCRNHSYGGFSDIFRYYLLRQVGGWYCDMDVTCLKNFSGIADKEYILRPHKFTKVVGNILKAPVDRPFLTACIEDTEREVDENNYRWIKPLEILQKNVEKFNLSDFIVSDDMFGSDNIQDLEKILSVGYIEGKIKLPEYAIHWCNEAVTTGQWDSRLRRSWDIPLPTTLYYKLLKKHKLL